MVCTRLIAGALAMALGVAIIVGCAKPPVEKAEELRARLARLEEKGARVFAQVRYAQEDARMAELQALMDGKENKRAGALADSIDESMAILESAVEINGGQMARMEVDRARKALAGMEALYEENRDAFSEEDLLAFEQQSAAIDAEIAGFFAGLEGKNFLTVYRDAGSAGDRIAEAFREAAAKAEAAQTREDGE